MEQLPQIILAILLVVGLEGLLSVDNAVVIASIANKAEPADRQKVIKYGIIGAFVFRGLSLAGISWLMTNPQVGGVAKVIGALWLLRIGYNMLTADSNEEDEVPGWLVKLVKFLALPAFIAVIVEVEVADMVFSIDNLFAVVAMTENIPGYVYGYPLAIVCCITGVFLGILTMRFITLYVMKLIEKYPGLNQSAAIVIVLLGVKLLISGVFTLAEPRSLTYFGEAGAALKPAADAIAPYRAGLNSHAADFIFSGLTLLIFLFPILTTWYRSRSGSPVTMKP